MNIRWSYSVVPKMTQLIRSRLGQDVEIRYDKPCHRCPAVAVNPYTGEKNTNLEPLRTLRSYRLVDPKNSAQDAKVRKSIGESPYFMVNYGLIQGGNVRVGDEVWAEVIPD